jgi:hypothetical protein
MIRTFWYGSVKNLTQCCGAGGAAIFCWSRAEIFEPAPAPGSNSHLTFFPKLSAFNEKN